nr:MAG TPA: TMEM95 family [Caudoviricetes sp.]
MCAAGYRCIGLSPARGSTMLCCFPQGVLG